MTDQRKPLWEVMDDAFHAATQGVPINLEARIGAAAQLRAIADEVDARIFSDQPIEAVVELLRAEADRAERGEVQ